MSVERKIYTDRNGVRKYCEYWTIRIRDSSGVVRDFSSRLTKRAQAEEMERQIRLIIGYGSQGMMIPPELMKWYQRQDPRVRERLSHWGIIDGPQSTSTATLEKLVADYASAMKLKGNGEDHTDQTASKLLTMFRDGNAVFWRDLENPEMPVLGAIRAMDLHTTTKRAYWSAVKSFINWAHHNKRLPWPLLHSARPAWKAVPADEQKGRRRREATPDEARAIIRAAADGPTMSGIDGPGWALVYELAHQTGFRRKEIATLTPSRCRLATLPHSVRVTAGYAKAGKERTMPIDGDFAQRLAAYIEGHQIDPETPMFKLPRNTGAIIERHCRLARVPYKTADGVLDLHALRHTFGSHIGRQADAKTAQKLLGHANVATTMRYLHSRSSDEQHALDSLPKLTTTKTA